MRRSVIWAAAPVLAAAAAASGADIVATFNGFLMSEGVNISRNFGVGYTGVNAGAFDWTRTGGTGADPTGNFIAFCIELDQFVAPGNSYSYDAVALDLAPQPFPPSTAMGVPRAEAIARLWYNFYGVATANSINAAAFQCAVWEIIYNDDMTFGLTSGLFQVENNGATAAAIIALADGWLSTVLAGPMANVYALSSNDLLGNAQDMLVPTPGAIALAGLGGLAMLRRRR